ncbi:hypothetical protein PV327_000485 [Microctonus hyperodae]|uniref:Uncharacterized protein n=1 Tax=Microctonus hyperodae TaxID=165561 RepID=A0AA39L2E8_MICHY|nr:hypothetical protein PV327_000485 [Microctonus hyperodae]
MSQLKILDVTQIRFGVMRIFRGIRTNAILRDSKSTTTSSSKFSGGQLIKPSTWEKVLLVFSKKFPNKKSIPETISLETMQLAMTRARIRSANFMMLFALLGCAYVIITGKQEVKKKMNNIEITNNEIRRQITAEYAASLEADASKK